MAEQKNGRTKEWQNRRMLQKRRSAEWKDDTKKIWQNGRTRRQDGRVADCRGGREEAGRIRTSFLFLVPDLIEQVGAVDGANKRFTPSHLEHVTHIILDSLCSRGLPKVVT